MGTQRVNPHTIIDSSQWYEAIFCKHSMYLLTSADTTRIPRTYVICLISSNYRQMLIQKPQLTTMGTLATGFC